MSLTTEQKATVSYKRDKGVSDTKTAKNYFEELQGGRVVYPADVWKDAIRIPATAPILVHEEVQGVVKRFIQLELYPVLGSPDAFYSVELVGAIPFNWGDGSYNYIVYENDGAQIPYGFGDYEVDNRSGVLRFYSGAPSGGAPKISFFKYVGGTGVNNTTNDYIDFIPKATEPDYLEGRMFYDANEKSFVCMNDLADVRHNIGEELWARFYNDNGFTLNNGDVVYVIGATGADIIVGLCDSTNLNNSVRALGVVTVDTDDTEHGYITRYGAVRDLDTSTFNIGDVLYVDPLNPGGLTTVRPMAPDYIVRIGVVIVSHATLGVIGVDTLAFGGTDTSNSIEGLLNGITTHIPEVSFLVDTGVVYAEVVNASDPTRKLPCVINYTQYYLNTLTGTGIGGAARVALTPGTDLIPQKNHIYIDIVAGVATLKASTVLPAGLISVLGTVSLRSVAATTTDGTLAFRRYNNAISHDDKGILVEILGRLRIEGSKYESGVDPSVSIATVGGAVDNVQLTLTGGIVWQFHRQGFTAPVANEYYILNHPDGVVKTDNLGSINVTADGTALSNQDIVGLTLVGIQSSGAVTDKIGVLLSENIYRNEDQAINDVNRYAVTSVPLGTGFADICFRVCRLVLEYRTSNGGTWLNTLLVETGSDFQDERGLPMGAVSGAGGNQSAGSTFADNVFALFNNVDPTKGLVFNLAGVGTGNTRTWTIPDKDINFGTVLTSTDYPALTNGTDATLLHNHDSRYSAKIETYTSVTGNAKGDPLYVSGWDSTNSRPYLSQAKANNISTMDALVYAINSASAGHAVNAARVGRLTGLDTSGSTLNAPVYVGLTGGFTTTKPTGLVQYIGTVDIVNATTGVINYNIVPIAGINAEGTDGAIQFKNGTGLGAATELHWSIANGALTVGGPSSITGRFVVRGSATLALVSQFTDHLENPVFEIVPDGSIRLYNTDSLITEEGSIWLDTSSNYLKLMKDTNVYYLNVDTFTALRDVLSTNPETGDIYAYNKTTGNLENHPTKDFDIIISRTALNLVEDTKLGFNHPGGYVLHTCVMAVSANPAGIISIGSTSGASDIIASLDATTGNTQVFATIDKKFFSLTADTELWCSSNLWQDGSISLYFIYIKAYN